MRSSTVPIGQVITGQTSRCSRGSRYVVPASRASAVVGTVARWPARTDADIPHPRVEGIRAAHAEFIDMVSKGAETA